jgi:hypothetical protein
MRVERDEHARQSFGARPFSDLGKHRLVTAVHAIERAERNDRAHQPSATTTRGFNT